VEFVYTCIQIVCPETSKGRAQLSDFVRGEEQRSADCRRRGTESKFDEGPKTPSLHVQSKHAATRGAGAAAVGEQKSF